MRALNRAGWHAKRNALPANLVPQVRSPLEHLADSNVVGIVFSRLDGTIVEANDAYLRMVGYSRSDIERGLRWSDLTPPEWMEVSRQAGAQAQLSGSTPAFEKEHLRKDGTRVPVLVGLTHLSTSETSKIHCVAFVVDMSERKRAEAQRDRLTVERMAMLESTGDGIYGLDKDGRCTFMNHAAAEMLGYEPKECLGKSMHDLVHAKRPDGSPYPKETCPVYRVFQTGRGQRSDKETLFRRDGTSFQIEGSAYPIVVNGSTEGIVVSIKDISDRKQADAACAPAKKDFTAPLLTPPPASSSPIGRVNLEVNRAFAEMTARRSRAGGHSLPEMAHADDLERDRQVLGHLLRQEIPGFVGQERFVRKEGSCCGLPLASRWPRTPPAPSATWFAIEDVTEKLRAESELRLSDQRYRSIVENTHEGICMCDAERKVTYSNPRLCTMLGYQAAAACLQCSRSI